MIQACFIGSALLLAGLLVPISTSAQQPERPKEVVVGIPGNYLPIAGVNLLGEPAGLLPDYWRLWSEKTNVPVKFVVASFGETLSMLRHDAIDVHATLFRNETRESWLDFTRPFHEATSGYYIRYDRHDIPSSAALDGKRIGVVRQTHQESFLRYGGHGFRIVTYSRSPEMLRALINGEIDAVLHEDEAIESLLHSSGVKGTVVRLPGEVLRNGIFSGFKQNRPALRNLIHWGFTQISRAEYAEIENRWIDDKDNRLFRPQGTIVAFNEVEEEFLRENKIIRVGMIDNWPPMNSVNAEGKPVGMSAQVAELINERLGGIITFAPGKWKDLLEDLKANRLDALFDMTPLESRIPFYKFTFPYLEIPFSVVTREDFGIINPLRQPGIRVAVEHNYASGRYVREDFPDANVIEFDSSVEALTAVVNGDADVYVGNVAAVRYLISENKKTLGKLKIGAPLPGRVSTQAIGTRHDWPILRGILNKALMSISPAQMKKITDPWLEGTIGGSIDINADEQRWLSDHADKTIRIFAGDWPPFHYSRDGEHRGLALEYIRHILDTLELKYEFSESTWKEAYEGISALKTFDILPTIAPSPERAKNVAMTRTYLSFPMVIFARVESSLISNLGDLAGKVVAVEKSFIMDARLQRDFPNIRLLHVDDTHQALTAVSNGKADAYVGNLAAGTFHIERHGLSNIKVAAPTRYADDRQAIGVRRDWPELVNLMEKVLDRMTEEEHAALRASALSVRFEYGVNYTEVLRYAIPVIVVVIVIIGVFIYANRKMAGEIAERKKAEERLQERESRFRSLLESAPDATLIVDPDGKIVRVNRQAEKLFGTDRTNLVGQPIELLVPDDITRKHKAYRDGFITSSAPREMGANMNLHAKRFDGKLFPVEISLSPIETADGTLIAASVRDVSERRRQEQILHEKDIQLTSALENMSGGMFMLDKELRVEVFNRKFQDQYHIPNLTPGTPLRDLILIRASRGDYGEGDVEQLVEERIAMYRTMEAARTEDVVPDGRIMEGYRQPTEDGGMVCVFNDITDRKQAEQALAEQTQKMTDLSQKLSRYLSPQIYEAIFSGASDANVTTERKKLTVFFSDIKNFTATTEEMEPEDMTYILNDYLTKMTEVALEYGGTIDKYIGDAIMVFFGDPETKGVKQDALAAVKMAVAMQRRMVDLRAKWSDMGFRSPFHIRCGVNTGYCNVGNFGSDQRIDYTIIGGQVNLAARLEGICEPDGVMLSHETYALVRDEIEADEQAPIEVKGIRDPVTPYAVSGIFDDWDETERYIRRDDVRGLRLWVDLMRMTEEQRLASIRELEEAIDILKKQTQTDDAAE
ncbi:MAG: transporter substrate-binding domain-containing protein [Rhodospirillales bacterium]|nr:transporter substrate-binding domain-containing protein [Rhodospirillales bacterium]MBO6787340.1 transporter substrate-binding domain-containing protein [Rhodospirillales bacterium]